MNNSDRVEHTYFKKRKQKGKKASSYTDFFSLRLSEKDKYAHDGQFFKDFLNYVVPANTTRLENYEKVKAVYEIVNNDLSKFRDKVDMFCDPLGEVISTFGKLEEDVQARPVLRNKLNVLIGEYIKRNDRHSIILLSAVAIRDQNKMLLDALKEAVDYELATEIRAMQMEMQGMEQDRINEFIEARRKELSLERIPTDPKIKSKYKIFYENALRFGQRDMDIKTLKIETLMDLLISDQLYIYSGWKYGKPHLEIRNPLFTGYLKSPSTRYVQKSDYVYYHKPITISDALDAYPNLSEDDVDRLISHSSSNSRDKRNGLMHAEPIFESLDLKEGKLYYDSTDPENPILSTLPSSRPASDKNIGAHQSKGNLNNRLDTLIWETHFEFKAYRKVIFLTYLNNDNKEVTVMVPDSYNIPEDANEEYVLNKWHQKTKRYTWVEQDTEYSAEELWVPRKYEIIRLGEDVYPYYGEVPFQETDLDNPYSTFNLSTYGLTMNARNAESLSLVQGAIPAFFQYLFVKHVQNKELAKYEGYIQDVDVDQIPMELGLDANGDTIRDPIATWMAVRKKTGINFYSGSQTKLGRPLPPTRSPGSTAKIIGTAQDIFNLQQLANLLEQEIGFSMGISPQREAQFSQNSNVSDNQQAIVQSSHITEPYFYFHSKVWDAVLNDYLEKFRLWQQRYFDEYPNAENNVLHYLGPDGKEELFKVTPDMLTPMKLGVYAEITSNDERYYEYMLANLQPIAQNAGEGAVMISKILKGIFSNTSPEEINELIEKEKAKQDERMHQQQMEQQRAQQAMQQEMQKREIENREDVQEHEKEKIVLEKSLEARIKDKELAAKEKNDDDVIPIQN